MPDEVTDGTPDLFLVPFQEVTAGFNSHQPSAGDTLRDHNRTRIGLRRIILRVNNQHRYDDLLKGEGLIFCGVRDIHVKQDAFRSCRDRQ